MSVPDDLDRRVDLALAALGGEESDFWITAYRRASGDDVAPSLLAECRIKDCRWGFTIGQMELWEVVADCHEHWANAHGSVPVSQSGERVAPN